MIPKNIRLFRLVCITLTLMVVALIATGKLWSKMAVSDLYRTYDNLPGIDATYLRGFPLNDTLTVDVTLLHATDSFGWETLKKDFNIADYPPEALLYVDTASVTFKYAPKCDHSKEKDTVTLNNDVVVFSRSRHDISVFEIQTENQIEAILSYKIKKIKDKTL